MVDSEPVSLVSPLATRPGVLKAPNRDQIISTPLKKVVFKLPPALTMDILKTLQDGKAGKTCAVDYMKLLGIIKQSVDLCNDRHAVTNNDVSAAMPETSMPGIVSLATVAPKQSESVLSAAKPKLETADVVPEDLFRELQKHATLLEGPNQAILSILLETRLCNATPSYCKAFLTMLGDIGFAFPLGIKPIICCVLKIFLPTPEALADPEYPKLCVFAHKFFRSFLKVLPKSVDAYLSAISDCFPYMNKSAEGQAMYVREILKMTPYLGEKAFSVLEIVFYRVLQIDCHCPRSLFEEEEEDEDEDDEEEEGEGETKMEEDIFSMDEDKQAEAKAAEEKEAEEKEAEKENPLIKALDLIMQELFDFVDRGCFDENQGGSRISNLERSKATFKSLLALFDKYIITTHKCLHIQYVMFYICGIRQIFYESFLDYLWKKVQNPNTAPLFRQAAASYIGSFLARAKFVPVSTLKDSINLMCRWIHQYLAQVTDAASTGVSTSRSVDRFRHCTFYSVCNSVFYVIAFRHRDLAECGDGLDFLRSLNLESIVTSSLNPLKFCESAVVTNFANVTRHYQVVYCYSIIERNNRASLPVVQETDAGLKKIQLDTYFPFDPYLLKRTLRVIEPLYRVYDPGNLPSDNSNSMDESGNEDEDMTATSCSYQSEKNLLFSYGTSPGFKQSTTLLHSP